MKTYILLIFCFVSQGIIAQSSKLKAGFDKEEYLELLEITARQRDTPWTNVTLPFPKHHQIVYRSPIVGLDNRWDLWMRDDSVAVISLRGTTRESISWLENFYSAMVPANGQLQLNDSTKWTYHLAENPQAAVHTGWLIGMASLSPDILRQIQACYNRGIHDFVLFGHSQGGAIAYLLRAYLADLQQKRQLATDIHFKTYCSAAPKPGNVYFAYEYEHLTQGGWGFNVVNTADWVPESPFSFQTAGDFSPVNPFINAPQMLKKQKFPLNLLLRYVYHRLDHSARKTTKVYRQYLGKQAYKIVHRSLKQYQSPSYSPSLNYARTGTSIVLYADSTYFANYPNDPSKLFIHHLASPYYFLAKRL